MYVLLIKVRSFLLVDVHFFLKQGMVAGLDLTTGQACNPADMGIFDNYRYVSKKKAKRVQKTFKNSFL
jgi:hypothetical protein